MREKGEKIVCGLVKWSGNKCFMGLCLLLFFAFHLICVLKRFSEMYAIKFKIKIFGSKCLKNAV